MGIIVYGLYTPQSTTSSCKVAHYNKSFSPRSALIRSSYSSSTDCQFFFMQSSYDTLSKYETSKFVSCTGRRIIDKR